MLGLAAPFFLVEGTCATGQRDIADLHARAMQALVAELRKQKRAETDSPRASDPRRRVTNVATPSRHVPAVVRRQVWTRDEARCRYVDDGRRRCSETARLELHHRVPYANGGLHDAENLDLLPSAQRFRGGARVIL